MDRRQIQQRFDTGSLISDSMEALVLFFGTDEAPELLVTDLSLLSVLESSTVTDPAIPRFGNNLTTDYNK